MKHYQEVDYVTYEESYSHRLQPRLKQLCFLAHSNKITANGYKELVYDIVEGSTITDKFVWFLDQVKQSQDKINLYRLCRNSVNKAKETVYSRPVYIRF